QRKWQVGKEHRHLFTLQLLLEHDLAVPVNAVNLVG
ncbi:MAG: hypothetical protein QOF90_1962, partial [Acetobacteraceae bacterium]|nr:hypothetical protein [Acetobacteraceae bacterium]